MLRAEANQLLPLQLGDLLALGQALRHRLAVHLRQLRLVVERLQMRRPARHGQPDDALCFWRKMRRIHYSGPVPAPGPGGRCAQQSRIDEGRQREGAQAL